MKTNLLDFDACHFDGKIMGGKGGKEDTSISL